MKTLPDSWIDKIFARMQGIYGREFTNQFSVIDNNGNDIGMANAKQVWAEELGGFVDAPEAISFALKNLSDRAPNAIKFREMCRQAPVKTIAQRLDYSKTDIDDEMAKANLQRIREMIIIKKVC